MMCVDLKRDEVLAMADHAWGEGQYALACALYEHLLAPTLSGETALGNVGFIKLRIEQYQRAQSAADGATDALRYHQDVQRAHQHLVEVRCALPRYHAVQHIEADVANWDAEFRRLEGAVSASDWMETISCADGILATYPRNTTACFLKEVATEMLKIEKRRDEILLATSQLKKLAASQGAEHRPESMLQILCKLATSYASLLRAFAAEAGALKTSLQRRPNLLGAIEFSLCAVQFNRNIGIEAMVAVLLEQFESALFTNKPEFAYFVLQGEAHAEMSTTGYKGIQAFFAGLEIAEPSLSAAKRQRYTEIIEALGESLPSASAEFAAAQAALKRENIYLHDELRAFAEVFQKYDAELKAVVHSKKAERAWSEAHDLLQSPQRVLPSRYGGPAAWYKQREKEATSFRSKLKEAIAAYDLRKQHTMLYGKQSGADLIPVNELEQERRQYLARRRSFLNGLLAVGFVLGGAVLGLLYLLFSTTKPPL